MNEWIVPLAKKEIARRTKVNTFKDAMPTFLGALESAVQSGVEVYRQHFPEEDFAVGPTQDHCGVLIRVLTSSSTPVKTMAAIFVDAVEQQASSTFWNTPEADAEPDLSNNWNVPLEFSPGLGIHEEELDQTGTVEHLTQRMLKPILFPRELAHRPKM